jgi:hypothetical protein
MLIVLAVRVIRLRRDTKIAIGSGGDARLERTIRVHANFCEYVPISLLLIAFVEMQENPAWQIHSLALTFLAGRLVHAYGVAQESENIQLRTIGMVMTFGVLIASAVSLLGAALRVAVS